ncbi:MAG: fimbrillin family protein [Muribaculaceae bacterium]|nr:fimbrillin family protein [Muribaculaceae bacterium]
MKNYILFAAAALSLSACNSDDNYFDESVSVQINATIGESAQSRASDDMWDKGDNIGVTMSDRYVNLKYVTENGDGTFSGTTMYFQNKVESLTLTAYYPYSGTEGQAPDIIEVTTSGDRQTPAEQLKFDFLYAVKENVSASNPNVNLSFSHMMSKLTFIFKNGNDGTDVSKITSYEIDGLILDGTFNPLSGVCAANSNSDDSPIVITLAEGTVQHDKELPPLIIFPQNIGNKTVKMKIHDSENQDYICELKFGDNGIVSGNNYKFTITVKKTGLSIHTAITDWKTEDLGGNAQSDDSDD